MRPRRFTGLAPGLLGLALLAGLGCGKYGPPMRSVSAPPPPAAAPAAAPAPAPAAEPAPAPDPAAGETLPPGGPFDQGSSDPGDWQP